jgi:murein L,D-transpeptidase YafK
VALLLSLLPPGGAWAQAFGSISSQDPAPPSVQPMPAATPLPAARAPAGNFDVADKVVVEKGHRRLYLLRQEQVIAEYPVKLGLNPYGPKQREGDFRTPEGSYHLVRRNPRSDFFLSIQVSYPSEQDLRRARSNGAKPGGLIMIHGEPNVPRKPTDYYAKNDWTDGCIAVSNADMVDIWLRTQAGIPIEIRP